VAHAISLIVEEVRRNMGLLGVVDLNGVNGDCVQRVGDRREDGVEV
jgi:L-lactate dehydrogenase (cytochrome)